MNVQTHSTSQIESNIIIAECNKRTCTIVCNSECVHTSSNDTVWTRPYQVFNLTRNSQCWKICSNSKPTKQMQSEWKTLRSNRMIRFLSLHVLLEYTCTDKQVNTGKERTKENKGFYYALTNLKSELHTQVGKHTHELASWSKIGN